MGRAATNVVGDAENIQATIHDSIQELAEVMLQREPRRRRSVRDEGEESEEEINPFSEYRSRHGDDGSDVLQERDDRRWESGFKINIPEFHGGVRGEELLDWLVAVEEAMEFKRVPEDRKVSLVATKFRGKGSILVVAGQGHQSKIGKGENPIMGEVTDVIEVHFPSL